MHWIATLMIHETNSLKPIVIMSQNAVKYEWKYIDELDTVGARNQ